MKLILSLLILSSVTLAQEWAPFKPAALNFALPNPYAAKDTIQNWYDEFFFTRFEKDEQELIKYVEKNKLAPGPFYCLDVQVDAVTTHMCNPWVIAVFISKGKFYVIHKRLKFFSTLNYMEVLKMNLQIEKWDQYFQIIIPYSSKYLNFDNNLKLALSYYYFYDYQMHDMCMSYECQETNRIKRKLSLQFTETVETDGAVSRNFPSYTWIYRAPLRGCDYNAAPTPCITAREVTYTVKQNEPTIWRSSLSFEKAIGKSWEGSVNWRVLEDDWASGLKSFDELGIH